MRIRSLRFNWVTICAILTVVYFTLIYLGITHLETLATTLGMSADVGKFVSDKYLNLIGDTLAGIFSPLALIWLVAAVLIQSQELKLQRQEIADNRAVMQDQAKAAEAQAHFVKLQSQPMQEQIELQKLVARANYKVSLLDERVSLYKYFRDYVGNMRGFEVNELDICIFKMSETRFVFGREVADLIQPSFFAAIETFTAVQEFEKNL